MVEVPYLSSKSEEEKDNISVLNFSLAELQTHIAALENGLNLFDFCTAEIFQLVESGPSKSHGMDKLLSFNRWRVIAARDWCMEIFHFAKTMEGIKALAHETPSVGAAIDREQLRSATRLFTQHFRDFEALRHAVAHAGELRTDPESWKENAAIAESLKRGGGVYEENIIQGSRGLEVGSRIMVKYGLVWVEDYFAGRTFYNTIEGRVVSVEISPETIKNLTNVKDEFYRSFPPSK